MKTKATILTAFNSNFRHIGGICAHSIKKYASEQGLKHAIETIPDDYPRPASWAKVNLIRKHLREADSVFWVDADAMIIGVGSYDTIVQPATLNIAKDENGINCGVMVWRNNGLADAALEAMEDGYSVYKDDPWFEQRPLMTLIENGAFGKDDIFYQPKHLFNAYPGEQTADTLVLHFPGLPGAEDRVVPMMEAALKYKL